MQIAKLNRLFFVCSLSRYNVSMFRLCRHLCVHLLDISYIAERACESEAVAVTKSQQR